MNNGMPVFIKIDNYKEVLEIMAVLRTKVVQARNILAKINEVKEQENEEIAAWQSSIEDVEKRIEGIDNILFEPDQL